MLIYVYVYALLRLFIGIMVIGYQAVVYSGDSLEKGV